MTDVLGTPGASAPGTVTPGRTGRRVPPNWLVWLGPLVFAVSLGAHLATIALWPNAHWTMIDMETYRGGAQHLLDGTGLYGGPVFRTLNFIYPPFAAILFVPLAALPTGLDRYVTFLGELALLYVISRYCWRRITGSEGLRLVALSLLSTGLGLWLDPVRITVYLGQVNLLLVALVLLDLCRRPGATRGVGVGIAAGIKLTPLIFIPFLLAARRFRDAAVAALAFGATVLVGFLAAPSDSVAYWIGGAFHETGRITDPGSVSNQSLNGALIRAVGDGLNEKGLWLACAALVAVCGIGLARRADRLGERHLALALVGLTGTAISPFSWNHHWVWVFPILVWLLARGTRHAALACGLLYAACLGFLDSYPPPSDTFAIPLSGWQYLPVGGWPRAVLLDNTWVLIYLGVLAVAGWWLLRTRPPAGKPAGRMSQA